MSVIDQLGSYGDGGTFTREEYRRIHGAGNPGIEAPPPPSIGADLR